MERLDHYKNLKYKVIIEFHPEDDFYFASFPDLPGCIAHGATEAEALAHAIEVKDEWLETALEEGWSIPEPSSLIEVSGRITLRMPKTLHQNLIDKAEDEGISLNQFILYLLAEGIGKRKVLEPVAHQITIIKSQVDRLCREREVAHDTVYFRGGIGLWQKKEMQRTVNNCLSNHGSGWPEILGIDKKTDLNESFCEDDLFIKET